MIKISLVFISVISLIHSNLFAGTGFKLEKIWESDSVFMSPECVVYDSVRGTLYVSNINDKKHPKGYDDTVFNECISKVDLDGNIIDLKWVENIHRPAGIAIFNDMLYVVERSSLLKVDIGKEKIEKRFPIPDPGMPNDIVIDKNGDIYISDSQKSKIYRFRNDTVELWLNDSLFKGTNGLLIDGNYLLIGNRGDNNIISVSLSDKSVKVLAKGISKGIDGIKKIGGYYLISWLTKIKIVNTNGYNQTLQNTKTKGDWRADFEFIKDKNILVVPTLRSNKVIAYKLIEK